MPELTTAQATKKLAEKVEKAKLSDLVEIYAELYPEQTPQMPPSAAEIAQTIRAGLEADVLVDLWNVVFPADRNVWYDEESSSIHYNEEAVGYAD